MLKKFFHSWSIGWLAAALLVLILAVGLRTYRLAELPVGMHQDEAWFAYNAFLLKNTARNIYGYQWPLTVDMWGDHVSSVHSFVIVPFITVLGFNYFAIRLALVSMTLLTLGVVAWLMYRLTGQKWIVWLVTLLYALSPWNIIMARASSSVVIDTLMVTILLSLGVWGMPKLATLPTNFKKWRRSEWLKWLSFVVGIYIFTIVTYFTYFTSRLMIPGLLVILGLWAAGQGYAKKHVLTAMAIILVAYLIFPFGVMLKTPFALGRFKETTILNSNYVQGRVFHDITRSGQAGMPVWMTRALFNKVTMNAYHTAKQYVAFFSPDTVLFNTAPPERYLVPNTGVVTWYEYLGFVLGLGYLAFGWTRISTSPADKKYWWAAFLSYGALALAVVPTALTIDDFPNFQRGVMATPFWQMAAGIGWFVALAPIIKALKEKYALTLVQTGAGVVFTSIILVQLIWFGVAYFGHTQYSNFYARSRAGEELAKWILANNPDASLLMDHDEANFLYFYMYAEQNILDLPITKSEHHFLKAQEFQIGNRMFVRNLCSRPDFLTLLTTKQPDLVVAKVFPAPDKCLFPPKQYELVQTIRYDDGAAGYEVHQRLP